MNLTVILEDIGILEEGKSYLDLTVMAIHFLLGDVLRFIKNNGFFGNISELRRKL